MLTGIYATARTNEPFETLKVAQTERNRTIMWPVDFTSEINVSIDLYIQPLCECHAFKARACMHRFMNAAPARGIDTGRKHVNYKQGSLGVL